MTLVRRMAPPRLAGPFSFEGPLIRFDDERAVLIRAAKDARLKFRGRHPCLPVPVALD